jgi:hypothetical protein
MPVVMTVTYRDSDVDGELAELRPQLLRHGRVVALEGLSPGEVAELMARATGTHTPPEAAVVDALYERAGSNPLFTRELVRFGLEVTDALPPTVGATLGARIGRLSSGSRRVLTVAALAGDEFTLDVVALAADLGGEEVLAATRRPPPAWWGWGPGRAGSGSPTPWPGRRRWRAPRCEPAPSAPTSRVSRSTGSCEARPHNRPGHLTPPR